MPDLESLSFALLIPFTVCFILLFIVCCFADKLKQIVCLPSQLPPSYIETNVHRRRRPNNHNTHHFRPLNNIEENRILISNEGDENRSISENPTEFNSSNFHTDIYGRMGVLPGFMFLSTPIYNPNSMNNTSNSRPLRTSNDVRNQPLPGFVVVQR